MKTYKPLLIIGAIVIGVLGAASALQAVPPYWCCQWSGEGWGHFEYDDEDYYVFQFWHAKTVYDGWLYDSIVGCWYDEYGHGGPFYGRRYKVNHAEIKKNTAAGVAYASGCPDPNEEPWGAGICEAYCENYIGSTVLSRTIYATWSGTWTGCCEEEDPNISCTWSVGVYGNGTFWEDEVDCIEVHLPGEELCD